MFLKKTNAITALLTTVLLIMHSLSTSLPLFFKSAKKLPVAFSYSLITLLFVHIVISLSMAIFTNEPHNKIRLYPNVEKSWVIQRISAIVMIPLAFVHAFSFNGLLKIDPVLMIVIHLLVIIAAYIHIPVSVPNALVSLGFPITIKRHKIIRLICSAICALLVVFGIASCIMEVILFL